MSDGVAAIWQLLVADPPLTALVPASRIQAGNLPRGVTLPAISITSISGNDLNIPSPGERRFVAERVQVTVFAANYPNQKAVMRAVRHAAADKMPVVAGLTNVSVHTDSTGPDFTNEDSSIRMRSQDFKVHYNEVR